MKTIASVAVITLHIIDIFKGTVNYDFKKGE